MNRNTQRFIAITLIVLSAFWARFELYELPLIDGLIFTGKTVFLALAVIGSVILCGAMIEFRTRRK